MALFFCFSDPKKTGISEKALGYAPEVVVEEAVLSGYRAIFYGDDGQTVVEDPRSITTGTIYDIHDDSLDALDKFNSEYNRITLPIGQHQVFLYTLKAEYIKEEYHCSDIDDDMTKAEKAEFLSTALTRFRDTRDATNMLRQEFVEDIRFKAGEQWPEVYAQERQRDERPMQTINRIDNFINTVVNQGLQNQPTVKIRPVDSVTDPATADVISGIIRHVIYNGDSKTAFDTAYDFAVSGGMGFIRARTEYCDEASFDQEIRIDRIENPCSVYFPVHLMQTLDYSDAPYAFIRQKISKDEFKKKYPDYEERFASWEQKGTGDDNWHEKDYIYIAEYFTVEEEDTELYLLPGSDGLPPVFSSELPKGITPIQQRTVRKKSVRWHLITEFDILESRKVLGKVIPIFPILGKESILDGVKHYVSLTRYLKEPQKMLNFWYSAFTEVISNAPRAPWLVEETQIANHKEFWENANKNLPYLPYKGSDLKGNLLPPPTRINPPEVGTSILSGIQYASEFMKDVSGIHDASLGATSNERTGKAIDARTNQGQLATYHFMNSYNRCVRALGKYLVDIIPFVYDTPRAIRIIGDDMTDTVALVNQMHPDVEGTARLYDLSVGKYEVVVTTGPSYDTRRQETQQMLGNLMQTNPQMSLVLTDIFAQISDIPGSEKITARMKKFLNMTFPGLLEENEMGTPEQQLQMQIQQMTVDIQNLMQKSEADEQIKAQMQAMLQDLDKQLKDKQAEISARLQVQNMKTEVDAYKAQIDLQKEVLRQQTAHETNAANIAAKSQRNAAN
jgi:hypothetical protein